MASILKGERQQRHHEAGHHVSLIAFDIVGKCFHCRVPAGRQWPVLPAPGNQSRLTPMIIVLASTMAADSLAASSILTARHLADHRWRFAGVLIIQRWPLKVLVSNVSTSSGLPITQRPSFTFVPGSGGCDWKQLSKALFSSLPNELVISPALTPARPERIFADARRAARRRLALSASLYFDLTKTRLFHKVDKLLLPVFAP